MGKTTCWICRDMGIVIYEKVYNKISYEMACRCRRGQITRNRISTVKRELAEELALDNFTNEAIIMSNGTESIKTRNGYFACINHIILLLVKIYGEWYNMSIDQRNEERGGSEMNTAKVKTTTPENKRVSKEKRDELYKKLTKKNKDIYERLAK